MAIDAGASTFDTRGSRVAGVMISTDTSTWLSFRCSPGTAISIKAKTIEYSRDAMLVHLIVSGNIL